MIRLAAIAASLALLASPAACAPHEDAGISVFQPSNPRDGETVRFRVDDGGGWEAMQAHVGPVDQGMGTHPFYDRRLTPGHSLSVEAELVRRGQMVARLTQRIQVESDRRYFVHAFVQPNDPTVGCMGCIGLTSAPIAGESGPDADRLWLYYSFNGISGPILF